MLVAGMLVLASAATSEVGAVGLDAVRRGLEDSFNLRAREVGLLLGEFRLNLFPIQHERDEYGFAASVGVGRQAGEAVAAVDQLFNCQEQGMILRHGAELQGRGVVVETPSEADGRAGVQGILRLRGIFAFAKTPLRSR